MRQVNRILKITKIDFPTISFITNSGEHRILDLKHHFKKLGIKKDDFGYKVISDERIFDDVTLLNNALTWENIIKKIQLPNGEIFEAFFQLDPLLSIENSIDDSISGKLNLGEQLKDLRKSQNLSQEELGERIGSNKQYISKLENNKTDPEFKTLRKIYEVGLNKSVFIAHYDQNNVLDSISNSLFKNRFLVWAETRKEDLELIEGIDQNIRILFSERNIKSITDLVNLTLAELTDIIWNKDKVFELDYPDSWITQAKFIYFSDWFNVIMLQRNLLAHNSESKFSKIEYLAKKELKDSIFIFD